MLKCPTNCSAADRSGAGKTAREFLARHGMYSAQTDLDLSLAEFLRQMRAGLAGEPSSLMMIPTYISAGVPPKNRRVLALDAGGTNFRAAVVSFDGAGAPTIERMEKRPMPGTRGKLTRDELFGAIADAIMPMADASDDVGFCFSFPAEILPSREGRILCFNKEVKIDGAEGALIGAGINAALSCRGKKPKRFTLLNDTVATLLTGMSGDTSRFDGYIGYILGTGTNTAYQERGGAIPKLPGANEPMIVNMESGGYDGFRQGTFDRELDGASEVPGDHKMEKMISGAYQGDLIYRTVRGAAKEGLFSDAFRRRLERFSTFSMLEISAYCAGETDSELAALPGNDAEAGILWTIVEDSFDRAARMTAVNFAAILTQTDTGRTPERPACITAEGTTFFKSPLFRPKLDGYIARWLNQKQKRYCAILQGEGATIYGSAVAALQV